MPRQTRFYSKWVIPPITSVATVANPSGFTFSNINMTFDGIWNTGVVSGVASGATKTLTGLVLRYDYTITMPLVGHIYLWTGGGGVLNDGDGIQNATIDLIDDLGVIVVTMNITCPNSGGPHIFAVTPKVTKIKNFNLYNIVGFTGGSPHVFWREIKLTP